MKVLEKVRGKRNRLVHIWDESEKDFLIGLCRIWINDDNWEIRERDENDLEGLCSRCLAKLERIRNPPPSPPPPPKKVRISKKARERNEREAERKSWDQKLKEWNELTAKKD